MGSASSTNSNPIWLHRLPRVRVVDRTDFLKKVAHGRRVIHLGFAGTVEPTEEEQADGVWLHKELSLTARELIGIDVNSRAVAQAKRAGYEAYTANCCRPGVAQSLNIPGADVVIAGELIEHLDHPATFLDEVHDLLTPTGSFVITTPNAFSVLSFLSVTRGYEFINPDHVSWYSWYTLTNLLRRHRWSVQEFLVYPYPGITDPSSRLAQNSLAIDRWLWKMLLQAEKAVIRYRPLLGSGLITVLQAAPHTSG